MEVKRYIKDLRIAAGQKHKPEWISGAQQLEEFVDKLMQTGELPERKPKIVRERENVLYSLDEEQIQQLNQEAGSLLPDETPIIDIIISLHTKPDPRIYRSNDLPLDWFIAAEQLNPQQKRTMDQILRPLRHSESGIKNLGDTRSKSVEQLKTIPGIGDRAAYVIKTIFEKHQEIPQN